MISKNLRSLSLGLTASSVDNVNCDNCKSIAETIQRKLGGVSFDQYSIKKNDQVNSLGSNKAGVTVEGKPITIYPSVLFSRLTILIKLWCMDDYIFDKSIFHFIQRFECYTTFIVKELLYNKKSNFYFYFKKCRNLHKYNRNQYIK